MNTKVEFCGKERKFKRCPNKTLKNYQKSIEDIRERMTPLVEQERDSQFQLDELDEEIQGINKHIELLEKLDDPSDDEIRECMNLTKRKLNLQKHIHELRVQFSEKAKEDEELYIELDDALKDAYCEFAEAIFDDFTKDDFEEADSTDLVIAPQLGDLYRLATTGARQKDVDKLYQKIVQDSFR